MRYEVCTVLKTTFAQSPVTAEARLSHDTASPIPRVVHKDLHEKTATNPGDLLCLLPKVIGGSGETAQWLLKRFRHGINAYDPNGCSRVT